MKDNELLIDLQRKIATQSFIIDIFSEILIENDLITQKEIITRVDDRIKEAVESMETQLGKSEEEKIFPLTGEGGLS